MKRPDTGASMASMASAASVSSMPADRQNKIRLKLLNRIMSIYNSMGGTPLGPAGQALVNSELEVLTQKGCIQEGDLRGVARRVHEAQSAEVAFRGSTRGSSSHSRQPSRRSASALDFRPSSSFLPQKGHHLTASRASTPQLPRSPLPVLSQSGTRKAPLDQGRPPLSAIRRKESAAEVNVLQVEQGDGNPESAGEEPAATLPPAVPPLDTTFGRSTLGKASEGSGKSTLGEFGPVRMKKYNERMANAEWEAKIQSEMTIYKEDQEKEVEERNHKQYEERESLDKQIAVYNKIKGAHRNLEDLFAEQENIKKRQWEDEQRLEGLKKLEVGKQERAALATEIVKREELRRVMDAKQKQEEEDYAQMVRDEHNKRMQDEQNKRMREKGEIQKYLEDNDVIIARKKQARKDEIEEEKRYLKEYSEYLDQKEAEYRDNLSKIHGKQQRRVKHAEKTYFKSLREMEARDAEKANSEQAERQRQLLADEQARKERIRQENKHMIDTLTSQVNEKNRLRREEEEEMRQLRYKMEAEVRHQEEARKEAFQQMRTEQRVRSEELSRQVDEATNRARNPMQIKIMGVS